MREITKGLWELTTPVKFSGITMPARTVVVQLGGGGVVVHSPGQLDDEIRAELETLGPVRGLIAPNRFHHLFVNEWREAYPEAAVYIAPELAAKRDDLADAEPLTGVAPALWSTEMEQHVWGGIPKIGEVVFVHRPTRTLLNTDMMHNMRDEPKWFARMAWRMLGAYGKFGPSRLERWWTKDKAELGSSLEHILAWDFDRVTVAHGEVLETGGKDLMRDAWSWALG